MIDPGIWRYSSKLWLRLYKNLIWPLKDPLNDPLLTPYGPKMKIFNFELEEKLDRHSDVEFDGESDGNGPEAQKPYLDP